MSEEVIPFSPTTNDVVCSKQKKWRQKHPGNVLFLGLVKHHLTEHHKQHPLKPTRLQYDAMVNAILEAVVHERHGRFLRPTDKSERRCVVLTPKDVLSKINITLRSRIWTTAAVATVSTPPINNNKTASSQAKTNKTKNASANTAAAATAKAASRTGNAKQGTHTIPAWRRENTSATIASRGEAETNRETTRSVRAADNTIHSTTVTAPPVQPPPPPPRPPLDNRTTHRENHHRNATMGRNIIVVNTTTPRLYGSERDEILMRRRLNDLRLPQIVADDLITLGVRCVNDIRLWIQINPDLVHQGRFKPLDALKLQRAFQRGIIDVPQQQQQQRQNQPDPQSRPQ